MFDIGKFKAIGVMAARQARERAAADYEAANDIIDMAPLLKEWREGKWEAHDVCVCEAMPYWCVIGHDSAGVLNWSPIDDNALWALYHGRDAEHALPFKAEGHNPYHKGHWALLDGVRYESVVDNNVWSPADYAKGWRKEGDTA